MAEMSTVRSHVLNYELYKVLAGYEESKIMGSEDADELRSENKIFCLKLDLTEEARQQAEYNAVKAKIMQKVCNDVRRRAELKLKLYEDMTYAKHKELAEVLADLWRANESLARLWAHTCADPKEVAEP
ncbi:hypothetical protein Fot_48234 [Forsythia ovata]|uniref:Uncharacterized protein n=1 Tax=Forsythia ovata TaxID=205694 RepID=A0ABD1QSN8_9LAMI